MMTVSDGSRCSAISLDETQCLAKFYEKNEDYRDVETNYNGRESLNRKIHFHIGDITEFKVDAIVCSTQTADLTLMPYGIHKHVTRQAGARYEDSCRQVGQCQAGKAFITQGYDLHANYIIHTAGPSPDTTLSYDERKDCLRESYSSCLNIVKNSPDIRTVAFPCLGSGGAGLQLGDAITTAVTTIREWLETDDNITHVDSIILVMYDENQWNEYYMELFKTFPYGKDLAGIDLETLDCVDKRTLAGVIPQTATSSHILCFQYKKSAAKHVIKHFHSLVNTLHRKVCTRSEPMDRHRNCATFVVSSPCENRIIVYQSQESLTLEVQVVSYNDNFVSFHKALCEEVHTVIDDYLLRNLENVTRFKKYIRCNSSGWGDCDGMVNVQRLKTRMSNHSTIQCRHRSRNNTTHTVNINEIASFWISQDQECLSSYHPEAREHDEITDELEDSVSWRSLASLSSSGSGGNLETKQDNIPAGAGGAERVPVEHSDDSHDNTLSKLKNFVKSKIQVLTKSNKSAAKDEENSLSSNYQPFDDSLSASDRKTPYQMITKGKELNIELPSEQQNTRNGQSDRTSTGSGQNDCTSTGSGRSDRSSTGSRSDRTSTGSGRSDRTSTGNERNSQTSSGSEHTSHISAEVEQKRTVSGSQHASNCDCRQSNDEESILTLSPRLNLDSLGACGGTDFPYSVQQDWSYRSDVTSLNDKSLLNIARLIGNRETQLGLELDLNYAVIQRIKSENAGDATMQAFCILREWRIMQRGRGSIQTLIDAMANCSIDISSLQTT